MRFMTIYKPADIKGLESGVPPTEDEMMRMGQFIEELTHEGVLLHADGLLPSSTGARLQLSNGQFAVVDGPFTEAKELIGGFAILRVKSKSQAIEITKRFLKIAGDGECEIRQMSDEAAGGT